MDLVSFRGYMMHLLPSDNVAEYRTSASEKPADVLRCANYGDCQRSLKIRVSFPAKWATSWG